MYTEYYSHFVIAPTITTYLSSTLLFEVFVQHRLTIRYCRFTIIFSVGKVSLEFVTISKRMFIDIAREMSLLLWMFYAF